MIPNRIISFNISTNLYSKIHDIKTHIIFNLSIYNSISSVIIILFRAALKLGRWQNKCDRQN